MNKKELYQWPFEIIKRILVVLGILFFSALTLSSFIYTTYVDNNEVVYYYKENVISLIAGMILLFIVSYAIYSLIMRNKKYEKYVLYACLLFVVLSSLALIFIIHIQPVADQDLVYSIAKQWNQQNFSAGQMGGYLSLHPNNLGITFILKKLDGIFGEKALDVFQIINVFGVAIIVRSSHDIADIVFHKISITAMTTFYTALFLPLIFYTTFIYGTILSLTFILIAMISILKYGQNLAIGNLIVSCISMFIAIQIKTNSMVCYIGIIIYILFIALKRKSLKIFVYLIVFCLSIQMARMATNTYFAKRYKVDFEHSVPMITWIEIGIIDKSPFAPGWYYEDVMTRFTDDDCNKKVMITQVKHNLYKQLRYYILHPDSTAQFFIEKFVSEWNDPTFQSIMILRSSGAANLNNPSTLNYKLAASISVGNISNLVRKYDDIYLSLITVFILIFLIKRRFLMSQEESLLLMMLVGGFIFHLIWEAKGQYTWLYFLMVLPFAGAGFDMFISSNIFNKCFKELNHLKKSFRKLIVRGYDHE